MSKKAKKRKRRTPSPSFSEEHHRRRSRSKTEASKWKHALSSSRDHHVHKSREDHRSRKDEAHRRREIKKPFYRQEKSKPTRAESPIFKEERRKHRKFENRGAQDTYSRSSSQEKFTTPKNDVLVPRSICHSAKKVDQKESSRKRRYDVLQAAADKTTDAKRPFVAKETTADQRNEPEQQKQTQREDLKTKFKVHDDATSKERSGTMKSTPKRAGSSPAPQHKTFKFYSKKSAVEEKHTKDHPALQSSSSKTRWSKEGVKTEASKASFRNSFSPVCDSVPLSSRKPNFKIPAVNVRTVTEGKASDKIKPSSIESDDKTLPVHRAERSSTVSKNTTETTTAETSTVKVSPAQQQTTPKETKTAPSLPPAGLLKFKIPKKTETVVQKTAVKDNSASASQSGADSSLMRNEPMPTDGTQHQSSTAVTPVQNASTQDLWSSPADTVSAHDAPAPEQDQEQVLEELHKARSQRRLEVELTQSYGELTCMDIDPTEESENECSEHGASSPEHYNILVMDTNILVNDLDFVKRALSRGLRGLGFPVVLIPWVVLQELDHLKVGRSVSRDVVHLVIPAISYIYNSLKRKESRLWGQSMQQAAVSSDGLNPENNDDRVLQCCLQYQQLYPGGDVILCTNDKNLCSKALLSGVKAYSRKDLEAEVDSSSSGSPLQQNVQMSSPAPRRRFYTRMPGNFHRHYSTKRKDSGVTDSSTSALDLSRLLCEFESCLLGALSDVLEAEMKVAYDELWLEIVSRKPPWSLDDVLQCLKKHWIAVFGQVVSRAKEQNVLNLIEFFSSGKSVDQTSVVAALRDANDLLEEFEARSHRVPGAISVIRNILNTLQTQGESSADVIMNEAEEDKQPSSHQVSHSEVWTLFESLWEHVCQTSMSVFTALDFDHTAPVSAPPAGGPPPPQDALLCLQRLVCTVSQLLQAFSSVLTSPGLAEAQNLLSLIQSIQIVDEDKLTAADLLNCFSQQEYRERLQTGGNQLLELRSALNRCVEFNGRHFTPQV